MPKKTRGTKPRTTPPTPVVSALMRRVRRHGTAPELAVRRVLSGLGVKWSHGRGLPGTPDLANRRAGWAILVHGCWWHAHGCGDGRAPKKDREWWLAKFSKNKARDARVVGELRELGFRVLVLWECETKDSRALARLRRFLGGLSGSRDATSTRAPAPRRRTSRPRRRP